MSALADEIRAAVRAEVDPLKAEVSELRRLLVERDLEELLCFKVAADDVDLSHGAFRAAAASDPDLRKLIVGSGRSLRIRRRDLRAWFAARKVRRRK